MASGFGAWGFGLRLWGWGLGFRVQGLGYWGLQLFGVRPHNSSGIQGITWVVWGLSKFMCFLGLKRFRCWGWAFSVPADIGLGVWC